MNFLCLLLDASFSLTSTPNAFEVILHKRAIQITYLLTYLCKVTSTSTTIRSIRHQDQSVVSVRLSIRHTDSRIKSYSEIRNFSQ